MARALTISIFIFSLLYFGLAIIGGVLSYSPVPFWDMWNGYLGFYAQVNTGDWAAWWENHNEHRIVLSRILFWLDNYLFNGRLIFLIVVNYLLMIAACLTFRKIILTKFEGQFKELSFTLSLVIYCLLFSWTQSENITWGFQSQFFLAQLVPLLAFYLLFKSAHKNSIAFFIASCIAGFLASMSMANGVITLPLMLLLGLLMRISINKVLVLLILAISTVTLYFSNYVAPSGHGSLGSTLFSDPILIVKYVLIYLGAPFYHLSGQGLHSQLIAQTFGVFLISSSAFFLFTTIKSQKPVNIDYVLLAFLLYVGGTALGTAGGRAIFGIEQALAGRYMTPVLMAWVALLILYIEQIKLLFNKTPNILLGSFLLIQVALFPSQLHALNNHKETHFQRMVGSLSLEIKTRDKTKVDNIFPSVDWATQLSQVGSKDNISIFSHPLIKDIREKIGTKLEILPPAVCQGSLDEVRTLTEDSKFLAIRGWIFDPVSHIHLDHAFLINSQQDIVGYVLIGSARPDVKLAVHEAAGNTGFEGYAASEASTGELRLVTPVCNLPVIFPNLPYITSKTVFGAYPDVIKADSITEVGDWTGSDFYHSQHHDLKVLGSFVTSDADIGRIKLVINNGDSIYYRSGPSSIGQHVRINKTTYNLPLANEWVLLTFEFKTEGPQEIILEDIGSEWGQWSAIAVRSSNDTRL